MFYEAEVCKLCPSGCCMQHDAFATIYLGPMAYDHFKGDTGLGMILHVKAFHAEAVIDVAPLDPEGAIAEAERLLAGESPSTGSGRGA